MVALLLNDHCAGLMRSDGLVSFLCARDTNLAGDVPSFFSGTTIACLRHFHESRNIVKRQKCKLVAYIFSLDTCHVNLDGTAKIKYRAGVAELADAQEASPLPSISTHLESAIYRLLSLVLVGAN